MAFPGPTRGPARRGLATLLALWPAGTLLLLLPATPARADTAADLVASLVNGCWACDTVDKVVEVGFALAEQAFTALAGETATLLGLLMAVWILFLAGRMFLPFGPGAHVGSLWNDGARKLLHLAVVLGFLQASQPFWDYVFIPVVGSGIGVASRIVTMGDAFEPADPTRPAQGAKDYCAAGGAGGGSGSSAAAAVMGQMNCPLSQIQNQFAKGIVVGAAVIFGAGQPSKDQVSSGWGILPSLSGLLAGLTYVAQVADRLICGITLIAVYFFGFIVFPFLLIDVLMRVTVTAVISPLAIAASMFRPTRRIAEKAVWNLAQSGLTLVFAAVAVAIAKAALSYTFRHLPTADGTPLDSWDALIKALGNPGQGGVYISLVSSSFYALLGVGLILLFMLRQATHMAAEFTGASGGDFSGAVRGTSALVGGVGYAAGTVVQKAGTLARRVARGAP